MLLSVNITEKSFGDKTLYSELSFNVEEGEKVGLIGRNGTGKSTLMRMITGDDTDYQGDVQVKRGSTVITSRQEHHGHEDKNVMEYIQGDLPEFAQLHHIITTYPETMGNSTKKLQEYSDALERFSSLGYFQIEDELGQMFDAYQLDKNKLESKLSELSGGQKRMIELIKVQRARAHLALIDEPTNHMDYIAKQEFIKWLSGAREAVLVITHDRDVLQVVDRIIEIRDGRAYTFKGNYDQYLRINRNQITSQVNEYDIVQSRITNLQADLIRFRRMKEKARDGGTIKRFKSLEQKVEAELAKLQQNERPSFWIDRAGAEDLTPKLTNAYEKYKARNINLDTRSKASRSSRTLVESKQLSLGYDDKPLFTDITFSLREGDRLRIHGRNGAGKTTLVQAVMATATGTDASSQRFGGQLRVEKELKIGLYEQEIASKYLSMKLSDAIMDSLREKGAPMSEQRVKQLMGNYLFNPVTDADTPIEQLSGGQKARFQLIRMLLNDPQLLILDEPTNHLDLPSIEELEDALNRYHGAIIYISHDSYFADRIGGETVTIA